MLQINHEIESLIDRALDEDLSIGDPTTDALIPSELTSSARIVSKAGGVLAGVDVALAVFKRIDPRLQVQALLQDGASLHPNDVIATVSGATASILKGERTALNFLQRISGIASKTNQYVQAVAGTKAYIIDTRKTTPGLRTLEKYAIRMGGGHNHRRNLGDGILIKDNHIQALRKEGMSLSEIIKKAYKNASHTVRVEVEVENLDEVRDALDAGAEILLLDNMGIAEMAEAVQLAKGKAVTEASGGINLRTVASVAQTGVDLISVGALTHSSEALDISLDME